MNRVDESFRLLVPQEGREVRRPDDPGTLFRVRALLRHKWTVALFALGALALGIFYVAHRAPRYMAEARLVVENIRLDASRQELVPAAANVDASLVDSQVEILKAPALAFKTIESLGLAKDPEFAGLADAKGWAATITDALPWLSYVLPIEKKAPTLHEAAIARSFESNLTVRRIGQSTVLGVGYSGTDPERSAQIANELIRHYLDEQVSSAAAYSNTVSAWLRDRVRDIGPKARVVSWASPPSQKEGPRALILLAAFGGIGTLLGIGFSLARIVSDTRLRDPATAASKLGGDFLGAVPALSPQQERRANAAKRAEAHGTLPHVPMLQNAVDCPRSSFAHLIRGIRAASSRRLTGTQILGLTSTQSGEGTTTIAANLAHSAAAAGQQVLLIDANIYKPDLSKALAPEAALGLIDIAVGRATLAEAIRPALEAPLHFLPCGSNEDCTQLFDRSAAIEILIRDWAKSYDVIIFDLPPTIPVADVAFTSAFVDLFILVVQWGRVPAPLAERGLSSAGINGKNLLGFIFNKVGRSQLDSAAFPAESFRSRHRRTAYVDERASCTRGGPSDAARHQVGRSMTGRRTTTA